MGLVLLLWAAVALAANIGAPLSPDRPSAAANDTRLAPAAPTPGVAGTSCAAPERSSVYEALNELFTCLVQTRIEPSETHRIAGQLNFGRIAGSGVVQTPLLTRHFTTAGLASASRSHRLYYELAALFAPEPSENKTEGSSPAKAAKIDAYLEHLETSPYIIDTYRTLKANDALPDDCQSLRDFVRRVLRDHWFKPYARQAKLHRRGVRDSSGFGHVFVGEISSRGGVTGFHNWLAILSAEEAGTFEYKGYFTLKTQPFVLAGVQFGWLGRQKSISSFAFGVDTEFQLALFSACYVVKPGRRTRLRIKELPVAVQTYTVEHQPESVGSAYFVT